MTAEIPDLEPGDHVPDVVALEAFLLAILEQHNGLCLDNEPERIRLAGALSAALLDIAGNDVVSTQQPAARRRDQTGSAPYAERPDSNSGK